MKSFFKKTIGKTGTIAALGMAETDVYTRPQAELFDKIIYHRLRSDSFAVFADVMYGRTEESTITVPDGDLIFEITDNEGNLLVSSKDSNKIMEWDQIFDYYGITDEEGHVFYQSYPESDDAQIYQFKVSMTNAYRENDYYRFVNRIVGLAYSLRYLIYPLLLLCLIVFVFAFVTLMSVSGRRVEEGLYPGPLNKVPFDLLCAAALGMLVLGIYILDDFRFTEDLLTVMIIICFVIFGICIFLGLCMSLACRIKQKNVVTGSFLYLFLQKCVIILRYLLKLMKRIGGFFMKLIKEIPLVWKTLLFLGITGILELIFYFEADALLFVERGILAVLVLYIALQMRRLQKGGEALAQGDLQYRVDTKGMVLDLKKHGEDLNSMITNVSHDIKTPLTSIINYADLIGKEKSSTKKTKEYAEVLTRQANRLKRLLDDLVEASKASTGNLEVDLIPCDAATFVTQAIGEYEDKLRQNKLTLITSVPDKQLSILADGRRMWRIFDNLMNNICKYALSGTRVYLSLEEIDGHAVFTFKNTSRDALNISEEELMERFTRGDKSRNTEGNGLGLSIARSMAELQKGELKLQIDGDLFKAILSFPLL